MAMTKHEVWLWANRRGYRDKTGSSGKLIKVRPDGGKWRVNIQDLSVRFEKEVKHPDPFGGKPRISWVRMRSWYLKKVKNQPPDLTAGEFNRGE